MKKMLLAVAVLAVVTGADAQTFRKGDIVVDANIGIGVAHDRNDINNPTNNNPVNIQSDKSNRITFTQRIGAEFGVWDINDNMGLGIGIDFQNAMGATNHYVTGTYNYDYVLTTYDRVVNSNRPGTQYTSSTSTKNRSGFGGAMARAQITDFNLTLRAVYHIQLINNLDTYAGVGFGVARVKYNYSDLDPLIGFSSESRMFDSKSDAIVQFAYSYNDLDHVVWQDDNAQGRFAFGLFLGGRYYLNDHWAVNAELGLPVMTYKKDYSHYNVFSVGASYKF